MKKITSLFLGFFVVGLLPLTAHSNHGEPHSKNKKYSIHRKNERLAQKKDNFDKKVSHSFKPVTKPISGYAAFLSQIQKNQIRTPHAITCPHHGPGLYTPDSSPSHASFSSEFCTVLDWFLKIENKISTPPGISQNAVHIKKLVSRIYYYLGKHCPDCLKKGKERVNVPPADFNHALEDALGSIVNPQGPYLTTSQGCVGWDAYPIAISIMATMGLYPGNPGTYWNSPFNIPGNVTFPDGTTCNNFEDCLTTAIKKCSGPYLKSPECIWYVDQDGNSDTAFIPTLCAVGMHITPSQGFTNLKTPSVCLLPSEDPKYTPTSLKGSGICKSFNLTLKSSTQSSSSGPAPAAKPRSKVSKE